MAMNQLFKQAETIYSEITLYKMHSSQMDMGFYLTTELRYA